MARRKPARKEIKPVWHPSGRPVHRRRHVAPGFSRCPPDEPLTPGLRPGREQTEAIGFTAGAVWEDDEE